MLVSPAVMPHSPEVLLTLQLPRALLHGRGSLGGGSLSSDQRQFAHVLSSPWTSSRTFFCSERSLGTCSRWLVFSKRGLKYCEQPLFPAFSGHRLFLPSHLFSPWTGTWMGWDALNQAGVQCLAGQWNDNRQKIWIFSFAVGRHPCLPGLSLRELWERN